ncbi:hypothetical protein NMY22_g17309 [Coprinellus aureogranulatus]|nr:hypothetical protein NMY22_g17309 [Coprinellus aureogranulatus]
MPSDALRAAAAHHTTAMSSSSATSRSHDCLISRRCGGQSGWLCPPMDASTIGRCQARSTFLPLISSLLRNSAAIAWVIFLHTSIDRVSVPATSVVASG